MRRITGFAVMDRLLPLSTETPGRGQGGGWEGDGSYATLPIHTLALPWKGREAIFELVASCLRRRVRCCCFCS